MLHTKEIVPKAWPLSDLYPLTVHWLKPSRITVPNYKGHWEMQSSVCPGGRG